MAHDSTATPSGDATSATIAVVPVTYELRREAPDLLFHPDACHVITVRSAGGDLLHILDTLAESDTVLPGLIADAKRVCADTGLQWGGADESVDFANMARISTAVMVADLGDVVWATS